jgi:hypothetical protein
MVAVALFSGMPWGWDVDEELRWRREAVGWEGPLISKVEVDEAVLAMDAECARSAVSSRVRRLTWRRDEYGFLRFVKVEGMTLFVLYVPRPLVLSLARDGARRVSWAVGAALACWVHFRCQNCSCW